MTLLPTASLIILGTAINKYRHYKKKEELRTRYEEFDKDFEKMMEEDMEAKIAEETKLIEKLGAAKAKKILHEILEVGNIMPAA